MAKAKLKTELLNSDKKPQEKLSHVTLLTKENDVEEVKKKKKKATKKNIMFEVRTANARVAAAKKLDIPQKLFGSFIYEEGLTIFFGNTHAGKTVVAMNIAESIASGNALNEIEMDAKPQKVVYFDFELSDKNFELKSSDQYENHFTYSENLIMVTPDLGLMKDTKLTAQDIIDSITSVVEKQEAKVFFVDNISWLETEGLETTKEANKIMKALWLLSRKG
jgi:archaellum biogenesis ATPase FlaH